MTYNTKGYHVSTIARASSMAYMLNYDARVYVMKHEDDERHIVVDAELGKIVKRFRDRETSWSDAERWANDYADKVHADE